MLLCGRGATFPELARFRVEAEAMACLNHPNIIKIRDVGVVAGCPYFALDLAEGGSLKQRLAGRPLPIRWSAELARTLAPALAHAHGRGMLHRDLKPANVLLMADGTPKLSDFGLVKFAVPLARVSASCCTFSVSVLDQELIRLARELEQPYQSISGLARADEELYTRSVWQRCAERTGLLSDPTRLEAVRDFVREARRQADAASLVDDLTASGAVMGSPSYMAPEQAAGDLGRISTRTDVYGLGVILYECLTGQPPFRAANVLDLLARVQNEPPTPPRQLRPEVPADLEAICLKCLEKGPERRHAGASALAEALTRFLETAPVEEAGVPSSAAAPIDTRSAPTRSWWWPFGRGVS
jgi:serine/threonine-protein kinase